MNQHLDRNTVILWWARLGIKDLYAAFCMNEIDGLSGYSTFFCQQGLEKFCKAYILGKHAHEYEHLSEQQAKVHSNKLAKNRLVMGHNLEEMFQKLITFGVLAETDLSEKYY